MMTPEERVVLLVAALTTLVFLALNLHYAGSLVLPLDDAYIYAQYARSIADGHAFRFTPGAELSNGFTGLLYPLLLAPFYKIGLRGDALPAVMFAVNALLFGLSALLVLRIARFSGRSDVAVLAGLLFALSGPLAWGYLTGMELGLFCTLWLAVAWALVLDAPVLAGVWLVALAWTRPEGWLWCWILAFGAPRLLGEASRVARSWRARWLPVAFGAVPLLVNLMLSGSLAPASAWPKSPFHLPHLHLPTILQHAVGFVLTVLRRLLTGVGGPDISGPLNQPDAWVHAAPLTLLLILLAVAARRRGTTGGGPALWATWLGASVLWVAGTTGSSVHHFRYVLPAWPAVVLLTAAGASVFARSLASEAARERVLRRTVAGYLLIFGALGMVSFGLLYGQEAHGFGRQYVATARWIDANLPPDARVASLDAGILGYYSGREFFDLFGLATPRMRGVTVFYADDEGTKCEVMERMSAEHRPTHFALHEKRFDHQSWNPYLALASRLPDGRPAVLHESRVLVDVPRVGASLQVWEVDWRLAGSGDLPMDRLEAGRIIDRVDVADPESELSHGVSITRAEPGFFGRNAYDRFPAPDGREIADGGRAIAGRLQLTISGLTPGRDVEIRLRTVASPFDTPLAVSVDGQPLGEWRLPPAGPGWREASIRVPGGAIPGVSATLSFEGVAMVYHLWALAVADAAPLP
jgi:hypothetical protein